MKRDEQYVLTGLDDLVVQVAIFQIEVEREA